MKIERKWAMPNKDTFTIKPIKELLEKYTEIGYWADPFSGWFSPADCTNDLDYNVPTIYHLDGLEFLKHLTENKHKVDGVLFDPPYSPRQLSECYKKHNRAVNMQTTQSKYWSDCKKEISKLVKKGGYCITFGWNSGGIGKKYGFKIIEILLVAHGGWHNDTICTVETKL